MQPNSRDTVILGLHLRDVQGYNLSLDTLSALVFLEDWLNNNAAQMDAGSGGSAVAMNLRATLRPGFAPNLVPLFGGGESGLSNFFKQIMAALRNNPGLVLDADEAQFIDDSLARAFNLLPPEAGTTLPELQAWYIDNILTGDLPKWTTLGSNDPLDPGLIPYGPLIAVAGGTNLSQLADSYTQFVEVGLTDGAQSMLALGESEQDSDPHALNQQLFWETGQLKPSPTTISGIRSLGGVTITVIYLP